MNREEIVNVISEWENNQGESFNDYFTHDTVDTKEWAEFLVKNGCEERGKEILSIIETGKWYVDQETMFEIKEVWGDNQTDEETSLSFDYNNGIIADFLIENKNYYNEFIEFLNDPQYITGTKGIVYS